MRRRGNPRRDALEYGVLLTVATSLSIGFGLLIYMKYNEDGENGRQRLNLNAPVDFQQAWRELQSFGRGGGAGSNNQSASRGGKNGGDKES